MGETKPRRSSEPATVYEDWFRRTLFERRATGRGYTLIAGVDEAGRGPLAGPVAAAAVILPRDMVLPGVDDSKRLSPNRRERLALEIRETAVAWHVAMVDVEFIDTHNIARATFHAMRLAVEGLDPSADYLLVDGFRIPDLSQAQEGIVGGDRLSVSVGAASILAKVARDAIMDGLALRYPGYGFENHKGYPTRSHREAIRALGPTPEHRRSFRLL